MASNDKNKDKKCLKDVNITYKKPEPSSSVTSNAPSVCPQTGDTFPRLGDCIHKSENDHFVNESFPEKADGRAFSDSLLALPSLLTILEDCEEEFSPGPVPNSDIREDNADLEDEVFSSNSFNETGLSRTKSTVDFTQYLETNNNETDKDLDNLKSDNYWFHPINDKDKTDKVLLWPDSGERLAKHASYLFHKDNRTEIPRMAELMPKGREFVVFNIFHDIARAFGHRNAKRKHVHFPEEFTQKYEQIGDVAGKDRVVPETQVAYKTNVRPKRKLSAVYTTFSVKCDEFVPRVERVEDTTKCEVVCQRNLEHGCDCCFKSKKPDLTVTLNGFISNLNLISLFIHAHGTRTFEHAMMILEFVKFHDPVGTDTEIKRNSVVCRCRKMNYAKQRFGVLSGAIWIFTFCIRTLIINETKKPSDEPTRLKMLPSESGFRIILEEFASFCLLISENVMAVLQYSQNFHNFCKECERLIRILRFHIEFEATLTYSKPLRRGDGLQLNKSISKTAMGKQKSLELLVKRCKKRSVDRSESPNGLLEAKVDPPPEWKSFSECTGSEKVACLKQLLVLANSGMTTVQTQLRFLLDDIAESAHDVTAQSDLLYLLADMLDRVKYLESFGRRNVKQELETCAANMNDLCKDFQEFINYGEHIIKRFIELRDVTHLCYEFMLKGLKIKSLEEMVPKNTFKKKHGLKLKLVEGHTGDREQKAYKKDRHHAKYKPMDFYRTYYHDMVTCKAEITTLKYRYQINPSNKPIEDFVPTLKHLRRYADPTNYLNTIASIDEMEYGDASEDSESDEDGEIRPQPIIKLTGSPFASPRGSVDSGNEE